MVKRNKMIPILLGLATMGTAAGTSMVAFAEKTGKFEDDFAAYSYESVDSSRYTLYGNGLFASNSGAMKITYDNSSKDENSGLFVNIEDLFDPGDDISLSFDYTNGNYSTAAAAQIGFYYDDVPGEVVYTTEAIKGQNGQNKAAVTNLPMTVPDYETSAYVYIRSGSNVNNAFIDNLSMIRVDENTYIPEGAEVSVLTAGQYDSLTRAELFADPCTGYSSAAQIPERYTPNMETAAFAGNSGCLEVYEKDKAAGHGLRISIQDIIAGSGLKAGDSFYLSFYYGCNNGYTASTVSARLAVNGVDAASGLLASNVYGENKAQTLYAKVTLPTNLPENISGMDLILETTNADHLFFKNIVISTKEAYMPAGAQVTVLNTRMQKG